MNSEWFHKAENNSLSFFAFNSLKKERKKNAAESMRKRRNYYNFKCQIEHLIGES